MVPLLIVMLFGADGGSEPASLCLKRAQWEFPKGAQTYPYETPSSEEMPRAPKAYFVRIDTRDPVDVSKTDVRVEDLDPLLEHRAEILADQRPIASLRFSFKNGPALALDHNLFYGEQSWYIRQSGKRDCPAAR